MDGGGSRPVCVRRMSSSHSDVTLRYVRHNNDVIFDVKTFLQFSWLKRGIVHRNCSYFNVTRTRTEPVLLWTAAIGIYMRTRVYYNLYTRVPGLGLVSVWTRSNTVVSPVREWFVARARSVSTAAGRWLLGCCRRSAENWLVHRATMTAQHQQSSSNTED